MFQQTERIWWALGLFFLLLTAFFYGRDAARSDEAIQRDAQRMLQQDFERCIAAWQQGNGQKSDANCLACQLQYDDHGRLYRWNRNDLLPEEEHINRLRDIPDSSLWQLKNHLYYQSRTQRGDSVSVVLIPLQISYDIQNESLVPYTFLGSLRRYFSVDEVRNRVEVIRGEAEGLQVLAQASSFTVVGVPLENFRHAGRRLGMIFFLLASLCIAIGAMKWATHRQQKRWVGESSFAFILVFARAILWWFDLPNFAEIPIFSPKILAYDDYIAPSLGDFSLNILLFFFLSWRLYLFAFPRIEKISNQLLKNPQIAWFVSLLCIAFSIILLQINASLFNSILRNSQLEIQFSEIFEFSSFVPLILIDTGGMLLGFLFIIFCLLKLPLKLIQRPKGKWLIPILFALCAVLNWQDWWLGSLIGFNLVLMGLVMYREPNVRISRHDLAGHFLILTSVSLSITFGVLQTANQRTQTRMERLAQKIYEGGAPETITAYAKMQQKIAFDASEGKLSKQWIEQERNVADFTQWMEDNYLSSDFEAFDTRLFLFDTLGNRLDQSSEYIPHFDPASDIPLADQGQEVFEGLYQISAPDFGQSYDDIFIGQFSIDVANDSTMQVMIEMYPSSFMMEGLYPILLMGEELAANLRELSNFDFAVYRDHSLFNRQGNSVFPLQLSTDFKRDTSFYHTQDLYNNFVYVSENNNKVVIVRSEKTNFFDRVTAFSSVFYLLVLIALLLLLPLRFNQIWEHGNILQSISLRVKIQLVLLGISVVPLIIIIFLLSPFIRERYFEQVQDELRESTHRVSSIVKEDYLLMQSNWFGQLSLQKEFQKMVREMEQAVRNDINVFDEDGRLIASTQPLVYESRILSGLMNPAVFQRMQEAGVSDMIIEEQIGNKAFLSGYQPIMSGQEKPIGYVNVPYLAKQERVDEQINNFLAYLVNAYLVLFLFIGIIAVLISNTITQPLLLIQQKLETTQLGDNDPIEYESQDEIGAIVKAYNHMLEKLSESEQKLAKTQREMAWKEVARQVAHEIKNPLTPMRLSIQHLKRAWESEHPKIDKMFPRVMQTLLAQIDTLVNIANSFSSFAKMPEPQNSDFALNEVLAEVTTLFAQSDEAEITTDIPEEAFQLHADRDQISRVFNNVIKNALQAMEESGKIHVSMKVQEADGSRWAHVEIEDNGSGMSEEVQKKIFVPNFSTKSSGMGLGLAMVKRIIETSGGKIDFQSKLGEGTTFYIDLPEGE